MKRINRYVKNIFAEELQNNNLYSYKGKFEVIYSEYNDGKYVFISYNDMYYYVDNVYRDIKLVSYDCKNISIENIPTNNNIQYLINIYKDLELPNDLLLFQSDIAESMFVSIYKKENGFLVLTKKKLLLDNNKLLFNDYCLLIPLPKNDSNFITYRAEYRCETEDMINLIYDLNEIHFNYPFSTTYNLEFALNWIGANILYVINVPFNCNYMLLKNNSSQFEITIQQGKLNIINKYKCMYKSKYHYIFICDFIPMFN
jgi:hypothetical protein